ncbi:MAG TPA: hypothetical protein VMM27_06230, partial [Casimicrobiaceae bacterium]|nr:hypothetical protein [Casimicrobiaceae bacterium]
MNAAARPAGAWSRQGISELIALLREQGFQVGTGEAVDATQLLLVLAEREPELQDSARLRARLRPVFCKSPDEQRRFDALFDRWWKTLVPRFREPPPVPAETAVETPAEPIGKKRSRLRWRVAVAILVAVAAAGYLAKFGPPHDGQQPTGAGVQPAPPVPPAVPVSGSTSEQQFDRYVPAVRYNVELRPVWFWTLGALPLLALLGVSLPALVLMRTRMRRRTEPMFLDPAPLAREARKLVLPLPEDIMAKLARHVRTRALEVDRLGRRPVLDVRGTLEATLRNRGIPTLRFSHARIHPSYLLLIDVANEKDPRGRLFYQWAERLRNQGLDVEILLFRKSTGSENESATVVVCDAGSGTAGGRRWRPFVQLRPPPVGERLMVISDGDPLVDREGVWRADALKARLHRWHDRALFTPVEPRDWGDREVAIEHSERVADPGFVVLPLEQSALAAWIDLVLTGHLSMIVLSDPQRFPALLRHERFSAFTEEEWLPSPDIVEKLVSQLLVYLGEQGFYWLAACAVPPFVRWELTLLLGQAVLKAAPRVSSEGALDEALARNYKRLVRLPWMQRQRMPTWLRVRLLAELSPRRQKHIRQVVDEQLGKLSPVARNENGIELGFDRPPEPGSKGARVSIRAALDDTRTDALYLGYMSGLTPEQLILRAPASWSSWADKLRLPRPAGPQGWLARARDVSRAWWARLAWTRGLPHMGINRASVALAALLTLPVIALLALVELRPPAKDPLYAQGNWLYAERPRLFAWNAGGSLSAVAFTPDGSRAVTSGTDGTLQVWDTSTGRPVAVLDQFFAVSSLAISADGNRIAVADSRGLQIRDVAGNGESFKRPVEAAFPIALSPDGTRVAFVTSKDALEVWTAGQAIPPGQPPAGTLSVTAIAFSPDGMHVVTGSIDATVRVWDATSGKPLLTFTRHRAPVIRVAFSPDGRRVVSSDRIILSRDRSRIDVSDRGSTLVWDWSAPDSSDVVQLETPGNAPVLHFAFTGDGSGILGAADDAILIWDARTGKRLGEPLLGHADPILGIAVSQNGERVISADVSGAFRLWNAAAVHELGAPLAGHTDTVISTAFTPDGKRLMSVSGDGTARMWDLAESGSSLTIASQQGALNSVDISSDGARMVLAGADGNLRLWD